MDERERNEEAFGPKLLEHEPVELERHVLGGIDEADVEITCAECGELFGDRQLTQFEAVRRIRIDELSDERRNQPVRKRTGESDRKRFPADRSAARRRDPVREAIDRGTRVGNEGCSRRGERHMTAVALEEMCIEEQLESANRS